MSLFLVLGGVQGARAQTWTSAPAVEEVAREAPPPPVGWQTEYGPFLRVHGPPESYGTVLRVARHASDRLPELADELGVPIGDTIHIYVAPTTQAFRDLQPGRPPTWADATAYPGQGIVYLRAAEARGGAADPIEQVLEHELTHILVGRAFLPNRPPSWLQEGVAQVVSGEHRPELSHELLRAAATGRLFSLGELARGFPGDPYAANLAYAQSADFISWLLTEHGEEALRDLIRRMARGETVEAAIYGSTGVFLEDLDRDWRARFVQSPIRWTTLIDENLLFGVAGLALVIGGLVRRREFQQRLREMEEEERLLDELVAQGRRPPEHAYWMQ